MAITQSDLDDVSKLLMVNSAGEYFAIHQRGDEYGSTQTVDAYHAAVHRGKLFTHSNIHQAVAAGGYIDHVLHVNSGTEPHARLGTVSADGGTFWVEFYANAQVSSLGSASITSNNNRAYSNGSGMTIHEASVVSSVGNLLFAGIISGTNQVGGNHDFSKDEWILDANENYLLRTWNKSTQARDISLTQTWYEL